MKENLRKCVKCGSSPSQDASITLHRFPNPGRTNSFRCEAWARYCFPNESWSSLDFQSKLYAQHKMLCNKHFKETCFFGNKLIRTAVPRKEHTENDNLTKSLESEESKNVILVKPNEVMETNLTMVNSSEVRTDDEELKIDKSIFCNNLDTCRTCLNNAPDGVFIDIFLQKQDSITVYEMLTSCTSINVFPEDNLPTKICSACNDCLVKFYRFKTQAENVNVKLWKYYEDNQNDPYKIPDIAVDTKSEICNKSEDIDCESYDSNTKDNESNSVKGSDNDLKKCDVCNKTFKKQSELDRHKFRHVNEELQCNLCSETFRSHNKFIKHLLTHSDPDHKPETNETNNVKCDICSATFKSVNSLSAHKRKHVDKERVLSCSVCKKIFDKISHLKRHEMCHENNRPYKCLICEKSFVTEAALNEHINKHNGVKPHVCPICSKSFSHLSTLTTHIKIHMREKSYLCPTCGKRFDSSSNLNQHVRRHLGQKMFACSLCPRKFVSKGELAAHSTTHTGVRSFTCDQCGATFTKQSTLGTHKLRHLGVKPHQCDACPMKFVTRHHLKRHYRIHSGEKPFRCSVCEHAFAQSNDLARHRRAHLGDNLHKCSQCSQSFRLKAELQQHMSEHFATPQVQEYHDDPPLMIADGNTSNIIMDGSSVIKFIGINEKDGLCDSL